MSECLTDLTYTDDGSPAPDANIHYSISFQMANRGDYTALMEHPDSQEIANTITNYMAENGYEALLNELKDEDTRSLRPETIEQLNASIAELIPILNSTYGLNIQGGNVNSRTFEADGCGAKSFFVPNDVGSIDQPQEQQHAEGIGVFKPL